MQHTATAIAQPVTVIVDGMGGDHAPQAAVEGAVAAARATPDISVIITGDTPVIEPYLAACRPLPANISVQHASQVVDMCDAPGVAIRQKRDSSISVGMRMVRDGKAQAMISAGNSGAMMAAAMLILKPQACIDRPAIATIFPTKTGSAVLLDAGATTDCKPQHLVQFALLGHAYARVVLGISSPRVGLLSIGEEPTKGDELTKMTHQLLLKTSGIHFAGNVEPKEFLQGEIDVVVCDGFVGNLMLKAGEGIGELIMSLMKREIMRHWHSRLAALLLKPALQRVKKLFDYAEYGGALLLGVNGVVVIGHGRSNTHAITNAVQAAARAARRQRELVDALQTILPVQDTMPAEELVKSPEGNS